MHDEVPWNRWDHSDYFALNVAPLLRLILLYRLSVGYDSDNEKRKEPEVPPPQGFGLFIADGYADRLRRAPRAIYGTPPPSATRASASKPSSVAASRLVQASPPTRSPRK